MILIHKHLSRCSMKYLCITSCCPGQQDMICGRLLANAFELFIGIFILFVVVVINYIFTQYYIFTHYLYILYINNMYV